MGSRGELVALGRAGPVRLTWSRLASRPTPRADGAMGLEVAPAGVAGLRGPATPGWVLNPRPNGW